MLLSSEVFDALLSALIVLLPLPFPFNVTVFLTTDTDVEALLSSVTFLHELQWKGKSDHSCISGSEPFNP